MGNYQLLYAKVAELQKEVLVSSIALSEVGYNLGIDKRMEVILKMSNYEDLLGALQHLKTDLDISLREKGKFIHHLEKPKKLLEKILSEETVEVS